VVRSSFGLVHRAGQRWRVAALSVAALSITLVGVASPVAAQSYSLTTQWQDVTQPTATGWSYQQGSNPLPWTAVWSGTQGAYAQNPEVAACVGSTAPFIPAIMKVAAGGLTGLDVQTGDIIAHSVDGCAGNPSAGEASLVWTSASARTVSLTGATWSLRGINRATAFDLLLMRGGLEISSLATGSMSFIGNVVGGTTGTNRANPFAFAANSVSMLAGDQLVFRLRTATGSVADYAGVRLDLTATATTVPEPSTYLLMATGLVGVLLVSRRRRSV
jgi:hypothetical protein